MSSKQMALDLIGRLPDAATAAEVVAAVATVLTDEDWDAGGLSDDEWHNLIMHTLATELNDPREDIYSLDDGVPIHDAR